MGTRAETKSDGEPQIKAVAEQSDHAATEVTPEQLDGLQTCLEDLLSKQNLAEDAFIQQHMNAQMYIPLSVLVTHHRIAKLGPGATVETLLTAAQRTDKVAVDEGQRLVRPVLKARRNTLILHDLPEDVGEEELRHLFASSSESGSLCSVKPDVNHTAFVSFHTDESAQTAALWLRSQKLRGAAIKCAVKNEHVIRSFFPAAPSPAISAMSGGSWPNSSWPNSPWTGPQHWPSGAGGYGGAGGEMWGGGGGGWEGAPEDTGGGHDKGGGKGKSCGKRCKGEGMPMSPHMDVSDPMAGMHGEAGMGIDGTSADMSDMDVGYKHQFRRYTRQDIIEICSGMEDVSKPESFAKFEKEDSGSVLLRPNPCKDWAPLPTPMLSFASSVLAEGAGGGRRGGARGEGGGDDKAGDDDHHGSRNRRNSRPQRKAPSSGHSGGGAGAGGKGGPGDEKGGDGPSKGASSWYKGGGDWSKSYGDDWGKGRADDPSIGEGSKGGGEWSKGGPGEWSKGEGKGKSWMDSGWADWYWDGSSWASYGGAACGGKAGSRERASSRRSGGDWSGAGEWSDWYGPTWQPKDQSSAAGGAMPSDAPKGGSARPSWAEKVKQAAQGADGRAGPQRWEVKRRTSEHQEGDFEAASPVASGEPHRASTAAPSTEAAGGDGEKSNGSGAAAAAGVAGGGEKEPSTKGAPAGPPAADSAPAAPAAAAATAPVPSSPSSPSPALSWADKVRQGK